MRGILGRYKTFAKNQAILAKEIELTPQNIRQILQEKSVMTKQIQLILDEIQAAYAHGYISYEDEDIKPIFNQIKPFLYQMQAIFQQKQCLPILNQIYPFLEQIRRVINKKKESAEQAQDATEEEKSVKDLIVMVNEILQTVELEQEKSEKSAQIKCLLESTNLEKLKSCLLEKSCEVTKAYKDSIREANPTNESLLYRIPQEEGALCLSPDNTEKLGDSKRLGHLLLSVQNANDVIFKEEARIFNTLIEEMEHFIANGMKDKESDFWIFLKIGEWSKKLKAYLNNQTIDDEPITVQNNRLKRYLPLFEMLFEKSKEISSLSTTTPIENRIKKINELNLKIEEIESEKLELLSTLKTAREKVQETVINKLTDGKLFNKEFGRLMYKKLLDHYLKMAEKTKKNLLYHEIKQLGKGSVRARILNQLKAVNFKLIDEVLTYAIRENRETSIEAISVLLLNMADLFHLRRDLSTGFNNEKGRCCRNK